MTGLSRHPESTDTKRVESMTMNPTIAPETRFQIIDLLQQYSTAIDTRDWVLFRNVFADDATIDFGFTTFDDPDAFTAYMQEGHDALGLTVHRVGNIVITPGEPMRVRSYGDNINMERSGATGQHGAAYYDDQLVHTPEGLKIARRDLTMVLFEPVTTNLAVPASQ